MSSELVSRVCKFEMYGIEMIFNHFRNPLDGKELVVDEKYMNLNKLSEKISEGWTVGVVENVSKSIDETAKGIIYRKILISDLSEIHIHVVLFDQNIDLKLIPGMVVRILNPEYCVALPEIGKTVQIDFIALRVIFSSQITIMGVCPDFKLCSHVKEGKKCQYSCKSNHDLCIYHKFELLKQIKSTRMDLVSSNGYVHEIRYIAPERRAVFHLLDDEFILNEKKRKKTNYMTKGGTSQQILYKFGVFNVEIM